LPPSSAITTRQTRVIGVTLVSATLFCLGSVASQAQRGASPAAAGGVSASAYSLEQVMSYPFPADLIASPSGERLAWTFVAKGVRSVWAADGPDFTARPLVTYTPEDGQELSAPAFSGDGKWVVYVRGGDPAANWSAERNLAPNPTSSPVQPRQQIWAVRADAPVGNKADGTASGGSAPVLLGEGDLPVPSPDGSRVAFEKDNEIWVAPIDASKPASRMFFARGRNESPVWSPDGRTLAFVTTRGSLGYIGLYSGDDQPLRYLSPSNALDEMPRWSPDGTRIAFVRRPGRGGPAAPPLDPRPQPWSIWVADVKTGEAREVWRGPDTRPGSMPNTLGGPNLHWGDGDRLVFLSYEDGWPHLYSIPAEASVSGAASSEAASSQTRKALLLTPGPFMVEFVSLTPDRKFVIYNANTGGEKDDIERRHLFKVPVNAATPVALTRGTGLEWSPVITASGRTLAYFAATAQKPPLPYVRLLDTVSNEGTTGAATRALAADQVTKDFPTAHLVTPEHVTFKAPDGTTVHGQLFMPPGGAGSAASGGGAGVATSAASGARKPAVVFAHGGPPRQMLLGWHYRFYYANSYALNQYLASRGFVVLSVNYRLGIGYGYDFHQPRDGGVRGASEYQDVLAAGKYLQARSDVDAARVGIWGGSYGGYLVALALGRNSDVFAAGVDIHGVHNRPYTPSEEVQTAAAVNDGVTRAQLDEAARVAWTASPVSSVSTWKSPVLLIHGDDDRNVRVEQTVDLARRLKAAGVTYEEVIIPDDIHDFLLYRNWLKVNRATADFFERRLKPSAATGTGSR
jgi:dipeptidyl aminopeptidase/acylaminoacyl peptidase